MRQSTGGDGGDVDPVVHGDGVGHDAEERRQDGGAARRVGHAPGEDGIVLERGGEHAGGPGQVVEAGAPDVGGGGVMLLRMP